MMNSPTTCDKGRGSSSPFRPQTTCPFCGSTDIEIGCAYQDCEICPDVEYSKCNKCKSGWGGALFWAPLSQNRKDLEYANKVLAGIENQNRRGFGP